MNKVIRVAALVIGALFFVAAASLYIYMHFFVGEGEDCNPFGFLPILQAGCGSTIVIWLMVIVVVAPGAFLCAWGSSGLETSAKNSRSNGG